MSSRRKVIQLDEQSSLPVAPPNTNLHAYDPDLDDDDDDSMGDAPTPERLVSQDFGMGDHHQIGGVKTELDSKVANFLAEIDALPAGMESEGAPPSLLPRDEDERSQSPALPPARPAPERSPEPPRRGRRDRDRDRDRSPARPPAGAYSNMFVKGTPEFTGKSSNKNKDQDSKPDMEPWPEEPVSQWKQLMDEKSQYPYYWHTTNNQVVWEMPEEFSRYLLLHKEYEDRVEKGLREGTLDPAMKNKAPAAPQQAPEKPSTQAQSKSETSSQRRSRSPDKSHSSSSHRDRKRRHSSHSSDSSSDSSDSDRGHSKHRAGERKRERSEELPSSSSTSGHKKLNKDKDNAKSTEPEFPDLPDSTASLEMSKAMSRPPKGAESSVSKPRPPAGPAPPSLEESMEFDIDDIDKELELALERKRQELMKLEDGKKEDKDKDGDRKKDEHRHRDDRKRDKHRDDDDGRRKHKHKDKDRDRDRKHKDKDGEKEEKKPKMTLKERLRIEMELKMEKERRKKRVIEELMAKELENTVVNVKSHNKRHREEADEPRKRYRDDEFYSRSRDDYHGDYRRGGYDAWADRRDQYSMYDDRVVPPPSVKPPPPTAEMIEYEEERRSKIVDYGHGRSKLNGESDPEDARTADMREAELRKLEALQLAELALSKLEFLEVTKKGLSKLQILLIELETRHQDWQAGGLTTNHFLSKLREANWQLEQYEGSAAPTGWQCSWDRDYRRYFYTHKLTGKTQWDYPDADDIEKEDKKAAAAEKRVKKDVEPEISSTSDRVKEYRAQKELVLASVQLPPPPPPPADEHPSMKGLQLMAAYGSTSESEQEEEDKREQQKKAKKEKEKEKEREKEKAVAPVSASPPPLPPLPPPQPAEEKHRDRERGERHRDKHKSKKKKKKKDKDKDKDRDAGPVGPQLPAMPPAPSTVEAGAQLDPGLAASYTTEQGPQPAPGTLGYTDPQQLVAPGTEGWYQQAGTAQEAPVYGPTSGPEVYGQNDQPLEFGSTADAQEDVDGMPLQTTSTAELSHPPETYNTAPYPDPYGGEIPLPQGDPTETAPTADTATGATQQAGEEKKKKKKDKMGTGNISLKKKHVSSMVMKWQKVKKEVEEEERHREIREQEIRKKLAELE